MPAPTHGGIRTRADRHDGGWLINGAKTFISNAGTDMSFGVTLLARTPAPDGAPRGTGASSYRRTPRASRWDPKMRGIGWQRPGHPGAVLRRRLGPRRPPGRRPRDGPRPVPGHPRGRAASRSPPCRSASPRRCSTWPSPTPAPAGPVRPARSPRSRPSSSSWPTSPRSWRRRAGSPTGPRRCATTASRSSGRRRWPSSRPAASPSPRRRRRSRSTAASAYMLESPVARFYCDAKVLEIGEGTNEIQHCRHRAHPGASGRLTAVRSPPGRGSPQRCRRRRAATRASRPGA